MRRSQKENHLGFKITCRGSIHLTEKVEDACSEKPKGFSGLKMVFTLKHKQGLKCHVRESASFFFPPV